MMQSTPKHTPIPELVAPAGTPEKLRTAFFFGADAVYLGLKRFSLRATAGNFTLDQLEWAIAHAHDMERKVYVALNVQPTDPEFPALEETLESLAALEPDAVIVADAGVLRVARRRAPKLSYHLSTQASVMNAEAAAFFFEAGISRIVLARELDIAQITALRGSAQGQLEVFVHGAVCIATSGRCFLSLYWADRDPRHGDCAAACRWPYTAIEDRRRPGQANPLEQDERGTHFFDAKDLCALPLLEALVDSGVGALKIEGRSRSQLYVGTTVDVYRRALDCIAKGDREQLRAQMPAWQVELARQAKRGFSTHFLDGKQDEAESYLPAGGSPLGGSAVYAGKVTKATGDYVDVALVNALRLRETVELCAPGMVRETHTPSTLTLA
ncbi:MAG: U32 family peptidase, partial [Deltaproteobacteria bacterium]|nr:U32 family peptidase [Deltaproteobacteria bacterium]